VWTAPTEAHHTAAAPAAEKGSRWAVKRTTLQGYRPPGRPPKHGARLFARLFEQNAVDGRTGPAKLMGGVADDLASDRGGWEYCTAAEEIAIRRAAFLTVLCATIENWVLHNGPISDGELVSVIRKGYGTHQQNLIRTLSLLGLRPDRAERLPTLAEYLASRGASSQGAGNGTDAQQDSAGPTNEAAADAVAPADAADGGGE
jgi:hypothetical protein